MSYLDKMIECAQKLGGLSAAAIFALFSIAQAYYIYKTQKEAAESNERWRLTRESQIKGDDAQTAVVSKLVDVASMNTFAINAQTSRIDHLATIIDERIPKGGNHA